MKTQFVRTLFVSALCLLAAAVRAADTAGAKGVQFKGGSVLVFRGGGPAEVATNEIALPPSVKVMTNGAFTVEGGKPRLLREGQSIDADGYLTSLDGTVEPVVNHLVMKNGQLLRVQDGVAAKAAGEVTLGDGTRIKPDGSMMGKDGRLRRMLDGQTMKLSGDAVSAIDTVTVKGGKVILQKDGGRVTLKPGQTIAMSDGSKVYADGTVLRPDGTKKKVAEGEIYKLPGVLPPK